MQACVDSEFSLQIEWSWNIKSVVSINEYAYNFADLSRSQEKPKLVILGADRIWYYMNS